jgi:hypothetical protein
MEVANTLAHYDAATITAVKGFKALAQASSFCLLKTKEDTDGYQRLDSDFESKTNLLKLFLMVTKLACLMFIKY